MIPAMRETASSKADRLLTSGAVSVSWIVEEQIRAKVKGDSDTYLVTRDPAGWRCPCASFGRCSHIEAVRKVTTAIGPVRWAEAPEPTRPSDYVA